MSVVTSASPTTTRFFEDGEEVYPCRCGETHRGPYALYDWMHHNCFHRAGLHRVLDDDPNYLMCVECGEVFHVDDD